MASTPKPPAVESSPSAAPRLTDDELRAWMIEYGPALRSYFSRRANAADAEDLVQDVFIRLHQRDGALPIGNIAGYLFRTAASVLARRNEKLGWRWGNQIPLEHIPPMVEEHSPE